MSGRIHFPTSRFPAGEKSTFMLRRAMLAECSSAGIEARKKPLRNVPEGMLVAHTGFEPVISALRGRRPGPLDECAVKPTYFRGCRLSSLVAGIARTPSIAHLAPLRQTMLSRIGAKARRRKVSP